MNNIKRILQHHFTMLLFLLVSNTMLLFISFLYGTDNNIAIAQQQQQQQQVQQTAQGSPIALIPGLTGNILAAVSFLIGTSSFILGQRIQSVSKNILPTSYSTTATKETQSTSPLPSEINKYFDFLILALVVPSIVINVYGIFMVGSHLYPEDMPYLLLLFVLFIPMTVILFLLKKLRG
jgi:hypothetical protein